MADYMVVASGTSSRQVAAMAEHIEFKLKQNKVAVLGLEGLRQADWVLIDANDVIVHLFRPEVREFYGLERMWADDAPKKSSLLVPTASPPSTCPNPKGVNHATFYCRRWQKPRFSRTSPR